MLKAGSAGFTLTFTYTAVDEEGTPINMNGGKVRVDIPDPDDWAVTIAKITSITDGGERLYLRTARLIENPVTLDEVGDP